MKKGRLQPGKNTPVSSGSKSKMTSKSSYSAKNPRTRTSLTPGGKKKETSFGVDAPAKKEYIKSKSTMSSDRATGEEFRNAFSAARKEGKKTFTFKGQSYTTKLKGE